MPMNLLRTIAIVVMFACRAWAQADANKGQILGMVTDPNGAAVPNAAVTIRNTGTALTRELKTDGAGQFRALLLDPGDYEVSGQAAGFAVATLSGVLLPVGGTVNAEIGLEIESTVTTLEVSDSLLQAFLPQATTNLNTAAIRNLPILGRRFQDFATLTPTVQVDPQRGQLSFAGQRGINSNVMLDGTDYNQPFLGASAAGRDPTWRSPCLKARFRSFKQSPAVTRLNMDARPGAY